MLTVIQQQQHYGEEITMENQFVTHVRFLNKLIYKKETIKSHITDVYKFFKFKKCSDNYRSSISNLFI